LAQIGKRSIREQVTLALRENILPPRRAHRAAAVSARYSWRNAPMSTLPFDARNIRWNTIEGFDHLAYHVCAVDETKRIVDILFKFDANAKIALHRHKADYITLVLQGELRLYRADGTLKEIRPVGSYVAGRADGEPHTEGGGDQDVIAFFSNRNVDTLVYEILDAELNTVATFGIAEFKALLEAQAPQPSTAVA
jgi:quercetin dioxygenase-like cupin family protein